MKRFIRYLYEYENGKRVRNVGFVKVEKNEERYQIQIYGKGLNLGVQKKLDVYVFYMQGEVCIGVPQGSISEASPVINYMLKFEVGDIGKEETFEAIKGIILSSPNDRKYVAVWDDMPVDVEHMREASDTLQETEQEEIEIKPQVGEKLDAVEDEVRNEEQGEIERQEAGTQCEDLENQEVMAADLEEEVDDYVTPSTMTYEKIQRQDLARLPRREWRLANNNFLLHGYHNYHHLLYIEENGNTWIGVPGICHEKERVAAQAFGFPQFHRVTDEEIQLSEEERNTYDDFGYWCRQVSKN